ncbi:hypothetical protein AYI69_g6353 [Smittium culicis]|uniref:TM7S3/TM198-like domain-containing protein n=1 Tax=Smittium culicis TaxID=133412 RepID=A0A1R1WZV3_9FUNG|nr:hypothetical protein AYI69_g11267 [Smittium culicis]OMJ20073.1 hypothetical protein AYI69_g6353 [Smittium culicis]
MLVSEIILSVCLYIPFGLAIAFGANKFFRITAYVAGFFVIEQIISGIGYQIASSFGNAVVPIVSILVGIAAAFAFIIIPVLGFTATGGMVGYALGQFVVLLANKDIFYNGWIHFLYLVGCAAVSIVLLFVEEYGVYTVGTAFWGGMLFVMGVDVFAQTGVNSVLLYRWDQSVEIGANKSGWALMTTWFLITILGSLIQNKLFNGMLNRTTPFVFKIKRNKEEVEDDAVV